MTKPEVLYISLSCPTCGQAFYAPYEASHIQQIQDQNMQKAYNKAEGEVARCRHD